MKKSFSCIFLFLCISFFTAHALPAAGKKSIRHLSNEKKLQGPKTFSKDPYLGAILVDAATGKTLFEDNPDIVSSPASIVKLMDLLIILELAKNKELSLQDIVTITAESAKIGGSQVYLKEGEAFSVDELLYALMVQSGNDAAVALAIHVAGTKEAFVELMNKKARQLGMTATKYHSVHGLPPGKDQIADQSTPRDIATLCLELLKWDVLRYTSVRERPFRTDAAEPLLMRNHNHLLGSFNGCDGFKTGYYRVAGFSVAATAAKNNHRAIAVIFGSKNRKVRDAKAKELLAKGLAELSRQAPLPAPAVQAPVKPQKMLTAEAVADKDVIRISTMSLKVIGISLASGIILIAAIVFFKGKKKKNLLNS